MAIDRIESLFDIPAIQGEFAAVKSGLSDSQKGLTDLYTVIKGFKDTGISDLAANTDKLSQAINGSVQATQKAKQQFDDLTNRISAQVSAANDNATAINKSSQAYDSLIKQAVKNKIALDDLAASQAQLKKTFQDGVISGNEYEDSLTKIKTAQQNLKTANADVTKTINNMSRELQSSSGSVDQVRAKLNQLVQQYDSLSEAERKTEGGINLEKTIQQLDAVKKALEGTTGRFGSNVGNYKDAFATLREDLVRVNAELAKMEGAKPGIQNMNPVGFKTASQRQQDGLTDQTGHGPTNFAGGMGFDPGRYKTLKEQAQALNIVLDNTDKSFSSITQATRASERALQTMAAAGLEGSEGFEKLRESTVQAAQAQKEFTRQQKLLESEAPVLGAITLAAKGLAGTYAVGAGAVSLFADGNERAEKELNKLVAIMTILQGLHEAYEFIQQSGAATASIRLALLKATNSVTKESIVTTKAAAVANTEDAVTAEASAVASTEQAAALQLEAGAASEAAVATEAAAAASSELSAALIGTGIGLAIAAIAIAISELASKMKEWMLGTGLSIKEQEALADAVKKASEALVEQVRIADEADQGLRKYYENQLALSQAAGQNEYKQTAIRRALVAEEKSLAQARIDGLGASYTSVSKLGQQIADLEAKKKAAADIEKGFSSVHIEDQSPIEKILNPAGGELKDVQEKQIKAAQDNQAFYQKQIESITALRDAQKGALSDRDAATLKSAQEEIAIAKFAADEERKVVLETGKMEVDAAKDRNAKIMADARSTSAQRIAAIKSDRNQEIKSAQLDRNNLDPNATVRETEIADAHLAAAKVKANADANEKIRIENRRAYEVQRDAALSVYKSQLQDRINADQDIQQGRVNNPDPLKPNKGPALSERLNALSDETKARRDILNAQLKEDLDKEGQTEEEKQAIYAKYNTDTIALYKGFQKSYLTLEEEARQKSLKEWQKYYDERKLQIEQSTDDQLKSLNDSHEGGKKFTQDQQKIEDETAVKRARNDVDESERQRGTTKDGTDDRVEADQKLAQSSLQLSNAIRKQKDDGQRDAKDQAEEDLENIQMAGNAIISLSDISYNTQKQHLEDLQRRQDRAYTQQEKNIQDTSGSEEQKAVRMKILDDQRATQQEQNAKKQKQLDIQKAEFDKAKAIMDIILNTAVAVIKAFPDVPLAIATGIAGAAELAIAVAAPIPKYKSGIGIGKGEHPGGLAVVGDGGEKELLLEPGKTPRWSAATSTIESLLPFTKVIPAHKIEEMTMRGMFVNQRGALIQTPDDGVKRELKQLREAIVWQTQELKAAASKNRSRTVINNRIDTNWGSYLNKNVFDRK